MTVCIVALAENKNKAVLIADKMLTNRNIISYQSDGDISKIFELSPTIKVLWSGGLNDCISILNEVKRSLEPNLTIKEIADHINQKHLDYLLKIIEREQIIGRGINGLNDFYGNQNINLLPEVRKIIDNALAINTLNSKPSFILCGKDVTDGLFKIFYLDSNPRNLPQPILDDYSIIGSGNMYAKFSILFSKEKYSSSLDVNKVTKIIKEAKKKAEMDTDVGKEEDLLILE